jgi:hypothetical protein
MKILNMFSHSLSGFASVLRLDGFEDLDMRIDVDIFRHGVIKGNIPDAQ